MKRPCEHCSLGLGDGLSLVYRVNLALTMDSKMADGVYVCALEFVYLLL